MWRTDWFAGTILVVDEKADTFPAGKVAGILGSVESKSCDEGTNEESADYVASTRGYHWVLFVAPLPPSAFDDLLATAWVTALISP
jgi:hypothetical protein